RAGFVRSALHLSPTRAMTTRADTRSSGAGRGQLRLAGVALAAPDWRREVNDWCDSLGLEPPTARGNGSSTTRPEPLSVILVGADGPAPTYLVATTDDLDAAVGRLTRTGSKLLAAPCRS